MNNKLSVALAADHAGYALKEELKVYLQSNGIGYHDFGTHSEESCDYPDFAHPLANAIEQNKYPLGISICGSGNGINMTANKHAGIRSALCWNAEISRLARLHNDANVCAIPARFVTTDEAVAIVAAFLHTNFEGGRHQKRIDKIPC